jgi:glycosyltransferase involved in cell wall biosynthesis
VTVNWLHWGGKADVIGGINVFDPVDLLSVGRFVRGSRSSILKWLEDRPAGHCLALWALPSGWFASQAKARLGIPYSAWCLGSDIYVWAKRPFLRGLTRSVLQDAENLFADAEDLCREVLALSGRECRFLPSLRLLPTGDSQRGVGHTPGGDTVGDSTAQGRHVPAASKRGAAAPGRRGYRFAYVGRIEKAKGILVALKALAAARRRVPGVTLDILGWGPDKDSAKAKCRELRLEHSVTFRGAGGPKEVASLLGECDCLLIPSYRDSIPLVFGEALQAGIPLVVTDVGDMGSLTREHNLGEVVPSGSAEELAAAMAKMVSSGPPPGYRERMVDLLRRFHPGVAAERFLSAAFG